VGKPKLVLSLVLKKGLNLESRVLKIKESVQSTLITELLTKIRIRNRDGFLPLLVFLSWEPIDEYDKGLLRSTRCI
jgi:hypothetical protein